MTCAYLTTFVYFLSATAVSTNSPAVESRLFICSTSIYFSLMICGLSLPTVFHPDHHLCFPQLTSGCLPFQSFSNFHCSSLPNLSPNNLPLMPLLITILGRRRHHNNYQNQMSSSSFNFCDMAKKKVKNMDLCRHSFLAQRLLIGELTSLGYVCRSVPFDRVVVIKVSRSMRLETIRTSEQHANPRHMW
jgi:hypothetical protein